MAEVKLFEVPKNKRTDQLEALDEVKSWVENDELHSLLIVAMTKDGNIENVGYYEDRVRMIGMLEYMKMKLMG